MANFLTYIQLNLIFILGVVVVLFVGIAYLTLLERKVLSYVQSRKGPNKVGFGGILQPFSDAIKLFTKEMLMVTKASLKMFYLMPVMSIFLLLLVWANYPTFTNIYFMDYSILLIILILSLNGYIIMMMGWSSGSLYSMIGSIRSIAQTLSYEVSFIMIIFIQMILSESYSLIDLVKWQDIVMYIWMLYPLMIIFFISILAELNRSPMDFIEGESELVSGFNVEYFSGLFALIFLSEYGMIIFMSYMMMYMYLSVMNSLVSCLYLGLIILLVIFMRGILPRMRYDELMYLCWKLILPLILNYMIYFMVFKCMFNLL